jgi:hypothetical protein
MKLCEYANNVYDLYIIDTICDANIIEKIRSIRESYILWVDPFYIYLLFPFIYENYMTSMYITKYSKDIIFEKLEGKIHYNFEIHFAD